MNELLCVRLVRRSGRELRQVTCRSWESANAALRSWCGRFEFVLTRDDGTTVDGCVNIDYDRRNVFDLQEAVRRRDRRPASPTSAEASGSVVEYVSHDGNRGAVALEGAFPRVGEVVSLVPGFIVADLLRSEKRVMAEELAQAELFGGWPADWSASAGGRKVGAAGRSKRRYSGAAMVCLRRNSIASLGAGWSKVATAPPKANVGRK